MKIVFKYFFCFSLGLSIGYFIKHFSTIELDALEEAKKIKEETLILKNEVINLKNEIIKHSKKQM